MPDAAQRAHRPMLYERTALSQKAGQRRLRKRAGEDARCAACRPLWSLNPYIPQFPGPADTWREGDLEAAIIREMESFCWSWAWASRSLPVEAHPDRRRRPSPRPAVHQPQAARRLVAVELKVGEFKAAYKGQMELYLRWLDLRRESKKPHRWGSSAPAEVQSRSSNWNWTSRASTWPIT